MSEQQSNQPSYPRACNGCSGHGGRTIETSHDGKIIQTWQICNGCSGTGVAGGGI
jgi:DnaJ-class molecular chaperone